MKPLENIPIQIRNRYGDLKAKRYYEIQKFVAAGCKYAEVDIFTSSNSKDKAYVEQIGYKNVINSYDFNAEIDCFVRKGKVYLERLDLKEGD